MKINYEYKNSPIPNYSDLYLNYPSSQFDSPYRSTIPLLHFWSDWHCFKRFMESVEIDSGVQSNVTFSFEYCVGVQKVGVEIVSGKPSQTDLMLMADEVGIAIEAKYTESQYDPVKTWKNDTNNKNNKMKVLEGWLNLIGAITGKFASLEDVDHIEYQMIHRLASACYLKVKNRILVYQLFDMDETKIRKYLSDLAELRQLVCINFDCFLINIPMIKSDSYAILQQRWDKGKRKMSEDVLKVIKDNNLIKYGEPRIIKL